MLRDRPTQCLQENVQTTSNVGEQETILGSEPISNPLRVELKEKENSGEEEAVGGQEKCAHIQTQRVVDGSDGPKETNHKGSKQICPAKKGEKMLVTLTGEAIVLVLDVRTTIECTDKLKTWEYRSDWFSTHKHQQHDYARVDSVAAGSSAILAGVF